MRRQPRARTPFSTLDGHRAPPAGRRCSRSRTDQPPLSAKLKTCTCPQSVSITALKAGQKSGPVSKTGSKFDPVQAAAALKLSVDNTYILYTCKAFPAHKESYDHGLPCTRRRNSGRSDNSHHGKLFR